jgi:hypothetical protein
MEDLISIIVPTRQRYSSITELWDSIMKTVQQKDNVELCLYLDNDDQETIDKIKNYSVNKKIKYVVGERIILSQMWNEAYKLADGDIIMHCGDDIRFRTLNWDNEIRKEFLKFSDKIVLVYCDDGIGCGSLATHSFLHRKWIEVSGFFLPPYFSSDYNDTWLDDVARRINRIVYLDKIYTEHLHYCVGKVTKDQNTLERLERLSKDNCPAIYEEKIEERIAHAEKLQIYIDRVK